MSWLQEIRRAKEAGDRQQALALVRRAVKEDPANHRAWLWLAGLVSSPEASLHYIERAEQLQPNDPAVAKARAWAEQRLAAGGAPAAAVEANSVPARAASLDALRKKARQQPETPEKRGRGRRALAVLAGIVLLLVLGAAGYVWSRQLLAPEDTALPLVDNVFVAKSNHFEPRQVAVVGEKPEATPTGVWQPISPKALDSSGKRETRPTWTPTPLPTATPTPEPTPVPTFISPNKDPIPLAVRPFGVGEDEKWIDVNLSTQTLVAYVGDEPVYDSLVSSGTANHPTVTGQFRIWLRYESQTMDGRRLGYDYYLEDVPYVMYFYEDYALHGTYWHNNFGTPMSHGCVNLPTPVAEWVYNWSAMGTMVSVHY